MARLSDDDKRKLKEDLVKNGLRVMRRAKKLCPVDTGRLRASITIADNTGLIERPGGEAQTGDGVTPPDGKYEVKVGTNVEYAPFVEFGTIHMAPQPFLRPSVDQVLNEQGNP